MNEKIKSWAGMKSIHPVVYDFLQKYSDFSESGFVYVTEGGWERISDCLETSKSDEEKEKYIRSILGEIGFIHFKSYFETHKNISVYVDTILNGDYVDITEKTFDINLALISEIIKKLNSEYEYLKISWGDDFEMTDGFSEWKNKINNSIAFFDSISPELITLFFITAKNTGLSETYIKRTK